MFAHKLPINIEDLLHQRRVESERIEYKESWNPEAVLHSICAFANDFHNLGSGYIIIGVREQNTDQDKPASGLDFPAPTDLDTVQATVQAGDLVEKTILRLLEPLQHEPLGGVLKCMLINGGQTKSNGDTVYLRCGSSKYHLLSPLPWAEYKAKRQIRQ